MTDAGVNGLGSTSAAIDSSGMEGPSVGNAGTVDHCADGANVIIYSKVDIIARKKRIETDSKIYYTQVGTEPRQCQTSPTKNLYWLALSSTYNYLSIENL